MDLKNEYKKETGHYVHFRETESGNKLYYENYVKWLEDRLVKLLPIQNVSDNCEWCGTEKENRNGLCRECGRFPSPSNYR